MATPSLLAGIGRWCFRRPQWVLGAWLAILVGGLAASGTVFARLTEDGSPRHVESYDGYRVLQDAGNDGGRIVGLVDRVDPAAPRVGELVRQACNDLLGIDAVARVQSPFGPEQAPPGKTYFSTDGRAFLVIVTLTKVGRTRRDNAIEAVTERLRQLVVRLADAGQESVRVRFGGNLALSRAVADAVQGDLNHAELLSLPLTLVLMVIVFRGLAAALVPVLSAVVSIGSAMLMLLAFGTFTNLDDSVITVVTIVGLALSIDYGLILVGRYRARPF